ncbi:MAG: hypothetical protein KDC53_17185 [Saprospiraceae bacterium]|nr:hypothetical protein [Saprospiraceae bacterium]
MLKLLHFALVMFVFISCQKDHEAPIVTENTLHYDGPNQNAPVLIRGISYPAIKFSPDFLGARSLAGKLLESVDFHLTDKPQHIKLLVFDWNADDERIPGDLIFQKDLQNLKRNSWNQYSFEDSIELSTRGIWIAFEIDTGDEDLRVIGCDPGPRVINGDIYGVFGGTNPGWIDFYEFSQQDTNINWNIRLELQP